MLLDVDWSLLARLWQLPGRCGLRAASCVEDFSESIEVVLVLVNLRLLHADMGLDLRKPVQSYQWLLLVLVDLAPARS